MLTHTHEHTHTQSHNHLHSHHISHTTHTTYTHHTTDTTSTHTAHHTTPQHPLLASSPSPHHTHSHKHYTITLTRTCSPLLPQKPPLRPEATAQTSLWDYYNLRRRLCGRGFNERAEAHTSKQPSGHLLRTCLGREGKILMKRRRTFLIKKRGHIMEKERVKR